MLYDYKEKSLCMPLKDLSTIQLTSKIVRKYAIKEAYKCTSLDAIQIWTSWKYLFQVLNLPSALMISS